MIPRLSFVFERSTHSRPGTRDTSGGTIYSSVSKKADAVDAECSLLTYVYANTHRSQVCGSTNFDRRVHTSNSHPDQDKNIPITSEISFCPFMVRTPKVMETFSFVFFRKLNSLGLLMWSVIRLKIISVPGVSRVLRLFFNVFICPPKPNKTEVW